MIVHIKVVSTKQQMYVICIRNEKSVFQDYT